MEVGKGLEPEKRVRPKRQRRQRRNGGPQGERERVNPFAHKVYQNFKIQPSIRTVFLLEVGKGLEPEKRVRPKRQRRQRRNGGPQGERERVNPFAHKVYQNFKIQPSIRTVFLLEVGKGLEPEKRVRPKRQRRQRRNGGPQGECERVNPFARKNHSNRLKG